jgi:hypothetical protein
VTVNAMKRVGLLLIVGLLAGAIVVQTGASAAGPVASASKKCKKKHGGKQKYKKKHKCKKKKGGSKPPTATTPTVNTSPLTISPASWNFGGFPRGFGSAPQQFTVTNSAAGATGPLSTSITGSNPGNFSKSGDACEGKSLDGGASCSLFLTCVSSGTLPATFSGSLLVSANPGGSREAALTCSQF